MPTQTSNSVTLESTYAPVVEAFEQLAAQLKQSSLSGREFGQLENWLETLPLAANEFALIRLRLQNTRRYVEVGEIGAARWESLMLWRQLRKLGQAKTAEPRRRLRSAE